MKILKTKKVFSVILCLLVIASGVVGEIYCRKNYGIGVKNIVIKQLLPNKKVVDIYCFEMTDNEHIFHFTLYADRRLKCVYGATSDISRDTMNKTWIELPMEVREKYLSWDEYIQFINILEKAKRVYGPTPNDRVGYGVSTDTYDIFAKYKGQYYDFIYMDTFQSEGLENENMFKQMFELLFAVSPIKYEAFEDWQH